MENIFRQALKLLPKIDAGQELTEEERLVYNAALIPLGYFYDDIPVRDGLKAMSAMLEPPPESTGLKFWGINGDKGGIPLTGVFRHDGRIACLVKRPSKNHSCRECRGTIDKGEPYYAVTSGGSGLGYIKFPDRVHIACLARHLGIPAPREYLQELWDALFDYACQHCAELHKSGRIYGYVACMRRVWKEAHRGSQD